MAVMGKDMNNVKFLLREKNHHNEDNNGRKNFKSTYNYRHYSEYSFTLSDLILTIPL